MSTATVPPVSSASSASSTSRRITAQPSRRKSNRVNVLDILTRKFFRGVSTFDELINDPDTRRPTLNLDKGTAWEQRWRKLLAQAYNSVQEYRGIDKRVYAVSAFGREVGSNVLNLDKLTKYLTMDSTAIFRTFANGDGKTEIPETAWERRMVAFIGDVYDYANAAIGSSRRVGGKLADATTETTETTKTTKTTKTKTTPVTYRYFRSDHASGKTYWRFGSDGSARWFNEGRNVAKSIYATVAELAKDTSVVEVDKDGNIINANPFPDKVRVPEKKRSRGCF